MNKINEYRDFVKSKIKMAALNGLPCESSEINQKLFPHQRDIVQWAVQGGQRAIFASYGLGKTMMQSEIVRILHDKTGARALIVCPLGVRQEFMRDGALLGVNFRFIRRTEEVEEADGAYFLTNYESIRDGRLNPGLFDIVSLDEASVLRSFGSKTYQNFLPMFETCKYKFVATATPDRTVQQSGRADLRSFRRPHDGALPRNHDGPLRRRVGAVRVVFRRWR